MTREQIDAILDRVRSWPQDRQEYAVRVLLALEKETGVYRLDDDERADIEAALGEDERGEVASEQEVAAVFARLTSGA